MLSPDQLEVPSPTPRLYFRRWHSDDLALALALWGDPKVSAFIGGPFSEEQVRRRLESEIAQQRAHGMQYWPVFLRDGQVHVGCCGIKPYDLGRGVLEIGFHLRSEFWGKGLATEAARAAMAYAFGPLGAQALFAGHHPQVC